MINVGMTALSRDGYRIGRVARLVDGDPLLPPGVIITIPRYFGICHHQVLLTTYDVRDVKDGRVILRISRWEANHRLPLAEQHARSDGLAPPSGAAPA